MSKLTRFIQYYKPQKKTFFLDMTCAFIIAALDLVFPVVTGTFLDDFIPNREIYLMIRYGIYLLILYGFRTICYYIMAYWGHIVGVSMEFDMRSDLFKHLHTLDFKYYDDNKTGQIMSRLTHDLREITELAHHGPEDLFISIIMLIGSFILMVRVNWQLTLIIFFFVIILIWFSLSYRKKMLDGFKATRRKHADINAHLESSISGIRLCKSFANEDFEIEKFEENNLTYFQSYDKAYRIMANYASGNNFLIDLLGVISIVGGGIFVYYNLITVPELVTFLLFTNAFVRPIRRLTQFMQQFQSGFAGFERFLEVMDIKGEIQSKPDAFAIREPKGEIKFVDVTFKYLENSKNILENFNLTIAPGKTVALVGPSGVGKTTVTHLIPRFYEVLKGQILVDGHNIKDLTIESLRSNIGFVQQDVIVFYGTIKENILYGKPNATEDEIVMAAKQANIHDFIISLPEQYETVVGERGVKLSGGQKQRLALSRVFIRNPPMLILDEATSSLDNATELAIQDSIEQVAKDRTTLIVAHRLSTIKNADEILVLTDEGIAERGTHDSLLAEKGIYSELYKAQFKGFIPDDINA
ncbi:Vitamin B12 import ATP-binding protein BtuD [Candidatus Lokiarchaeum ossiferum]|uniref:Vitamin B12 import ATP-binding protein BtuD n=1 Tax=Candidatus Lokiarchaeum ossiferum TaxID=2951803 RepID=A0ABY6HW00_9ARCH|nr:Vitamin B12 import ATP-binding protein BtuD [Candidatus Lokiarchaeum sp. B-35]